LSDLVPLPVVSGALITYADEHEAIRAFAENEKAASTREYYRVDFDDFVRWCKTRDLCPLPADPRTVAWHISTIATQWRDEDENDQTVWRKPLSASSIGRRLAGIACAHKLRKLPQPSWRMRESSSGAVPQDRQCSCGSLSMRGTRTTTVAIWCPAAEPAPDSCCCC